MLRSIVRPIANPLLRNTIVKPRFFSCARSHLDTVNHKLNVQSSMYKYLVNGPKFVKYTSQHEWLAVFEDDTAFVGITRYASEALGDVTFVEIPEVGDPVEVGESIGSIESVKSASEIYSPVSGEVYAVNEALESTPSLVNEDPQGEGWIAQIKLCDPKAIETSEELMDIEEYDKSLEDL